MENYKQWVEQKLTSEDMDKLPKIYKPLIQKQIILLIIKILILIFLFLNI
jgi:hypothetical protein